MDLFGYHAVYDRDFFDAIDYASENGFEFVSYDLNVPRFYLERLDAPEIDRLRTYSEEKGVGIAFHAPGDNISLFSDYPAIRRGILEHFSAIIDAAEQLNARHVCIHPGIYPSLKQVGKKDDDFSAEYADYYRGVLYENLMHLADRTKKTMLCVENFGFSPLAMDVVEKVLSETDQLYLTWDIAKTYNGELTRNEDVESFMLKHADRIREIHAHDIIKGFRSHQIIGDGGIDFTRYADIMKSPEIAITIEVRPREAAKVSKDRLAAMLADHA